PFTSAHPEFARLLCRPRVQNSISVGCRAGEEDLFARREKLIQTGPLVADHRRPAGGGFKEPDTGRIARPNHIGAGDIEGETLAVVKGAVLRWSEVEDVIDVRRPGNSFR